MAIMGSHISWKYLPFKYHHHLLSHSLLLWKFASSGKYLRFVSFRFMYSHQYGLVYFRFIPFIQMVFFFYTIPLRSDLHTIFSQNGSISLFSFGLSLYVVVPFFRVTILKAAILTITSDYIIGFWLFRCHIFPSFNHIHGTKWIQNENVGHQAWYCASQKYYCFYNKLH